MRLPFPMILVFSAGSRGLCGRPLDSFVFAITCCNVGKAAFGERNLRRKVDKHAGIVCRSHQLNRAKGSREELPCCGFWSKKKNIFAKAAGIFEGASKYINTRTEKGRDADGASESAEALTSVHVLPQELSTAKGATDFMKLTIYAKNMTVSPHVTRRIEKKTERMGRYLLPDTEMQVRLSKEPKRDIRTVEITVPMGNGVILRSEASEPENLFLAIDQALAKMERQIHRHRSKLDKRIRDDAFASNELEFIEDEDAAAEESVPEIVRRKTFPVRPMSVEDAAVQMEMLGHSFFAFVNAETEEINVLYQRKDGKLGLLEPEN
ncbi:MAG: ribosome-associated translation inhibitor RaiA [Clostridiales bacterium]|nr:ribosome-associated translation inhibitor RaiA [Clostridiales bacterium]